MLAVSNTSAEGPFSVPTQVLLLPASYLHFAAAAAVMEPGRLL